MLFRDLPGFCQEFFIGFRLSGIRSNPVWDFHINFIWELRTNPSEDPASSCRMEILTEVISGDFFTIFPWGSHQEFLMGWILPRSILWGSAGHSIWVSRPNPPSNSIGNTVWVFRQEFYLDIYCQEFFLGIPSRLPAASSKIFLRSFFHHQYFPRNLTTIPPKTFNFPSQGVL